MAPPKLSQEFLNLILKYNHLNGQFVWRHRPEITFLGDSHGRQMRAKKWNGRFANTPAFTAKNTGGYLHTKINDKVYLAHRVAWVMQFGDWPDIIDHINRVRDDNRICNLKNVNKAMNGRNRNISRNNTSGFQGVGFCISKKRWYAFGRDGQKRMHLGTYKQKSDAIEARARFEKAYNYAPKHDLQPLAPPRHKTPRRAQP